METNRNFANNGRKTDVPTQNMQHFMSNSPWLGPLLVGKVRADVAAQDEFQSGTMLLDWSHRFARDPELLAHYEVEVLPALSMANVRAMLTAAMPLLQSPEEATYLVVKHLDNRTRSRKSRLRSGSSP
ncbi:MAG: hypothetical protein IPM53_20750 [Anaerolineaceae bacterium]|nr:hypothetical protein [Anaerolineaceae bacterium]